MSLTRDDLQEIRAISEEGHEVLVNDVRAIYYMLASMQKSTITDKHFTKLSLNEKILTLNAELIAAAKKAGLTLPR